jgi:hypothetical protein
MHDKTRWKCSSAALPGKATASLAYCRKAIRQETHNHRLVFVVFLASEESGVNAERGGSGSFF